MTIPKINRQYHKEIAPSVWLMNDHKWAWYAWEYSSHNRPAKLIHLDYHWDSINDFTDPLDVGYLRSIDDHKQIEILTNDEKKMLVKEDSFIAPAIIRGLVNEIHFYCLQDDSSGFDKGFLNHYNSNQYIYSDIVKLSEATQTGPFILDIDLDLFNRATPYFANRDALLNVLFNVQRIATLAEVITIAKSDLYCWKSKDGDGYDWDEHTVNHVSSIVIPEILKLRNVQ